MNLNLLSKTRTTTFFINQPELFKRKAINWAQQFELTCLLDNNHYPGYLHHDQEFLLAAGNEGELVHRTEEGRGSGFDRLKSWAKEQDSWLFGFLAYDLKNEIEDLTSNHFDGLGFPDLHFFQPRYVLEVKGREVRIHTSLDADQVFEAILGTPAFEPELSEQEIKVQARIPKAEYLQIVEKIRKHILRGDIYEMNFCQEFYAENIQLDPLSIFSQLNEISKAPFSAYYRLRDRYLLCASPERFLKKEGQRIISQPIKGTIGRGDNPAEDRLQKEQLRNSQKDRSENVMIVDLVRNDLGRSCVAGSVVVDELFGLYPFKQVWQMISTVSGELRPELDAIDALRLAFPMGSMTGAPKVRSMQLIEQYERSRRGLYSGAVGYIRPDGNFDFNVVIRSLLYNASRQYLSFQVGGAIIYDSVAENEYDECLLKAKGMLTVLKQGLHLSSK